MSGPIKLWTQKDTSREVSHRSIPLEDRNHWRWASTRLTSEMGVWQTNAATRARSSNAAPRSAPTA